MVCSRLNGDQSQPSIQNPIILVIVATEQIKYLWLPLTRNNSLKVYHVQIAQLWTTRNFCVSNGRKMSHIQKQRDTSFAEKGRAHYEFNFFFAPIFTHQYKCIYELFLCSMITSSICMEGNSSSTIHQIIDIPAIKIFYSRWSCKKECKFTVLQFASAGAFCVNELPRSRQSSNSAKLAMPLNRVE